MGMSTHDNNKEGTLSLQRQQVINLMGSRKLFEDCLKAGWLIPVIRTGRLTLFDRNDVEEVWERIRIEGAPTKGESPE